MSHRIAPQYGTCPLERVSQRRKAKQTNEQREVLQKQNLRTIWPLVNVIFFTSSEKEDVQGFV